MPGTLYRVTDYDDVLCKPALTSQLLTPPHAATVSSSQCPWNVSNWLFVCCDSIMDLGEALANAVAIQEAILATI